MKLTGWFNRKIQKNIVAPFKDLMIEPPINEADSCTKANTASTRCFGARRVYGSYETEDSTNNSDIFKSILSIGTLGSESIPREEPATPKFTTILNSIVEKEVKITDTDLEKINEELDNFLEAEAKKALGKLSGENLTDIFSLGIEKTEKDCKDYESKTERRLQGYLFGSEIKCPEMNTEASKDKFSTEESSLEKPTKVKFEAKKKKKSASYLIKNVLKKFNPLKSSAPPSSGTENHSSKTKLQKSLKTLHKKIHPETPIASRGLCSSQKDKVNSPVLYDACYNEDAMHGSSGKDDSRCCEGLNNGIHSERSKMNLPVCELEDCSPRGKGEHWIKTDVDYLVLELKNGD